MSWLTAPPLSLYVHFPWCVRKCPYCDFNSYTLQGELAQQPYLARLIADLNAQAPGVRGRELISVFLGGGTPSLFSPDAIGRLLESVRRVLRCAADMEVTLEANPGAIERGAFAAYRAAGVTRVSLGAQSFDSERLKVLARIHSPEETQRAAEELHAAGLSNFNLDLMYALPGQDTGGACDDLSQALALSPAHVSHYQLTLEPGTVFAARPPPLPDEDLAAAMLEACAEMLGAAGFAHYEVSAYARADSRCRHNLNYWNFGDYLGIGAGAHGKLTDPARGEIVRTTQPREPRRYLAASDAQLSRQLVPETQRTFEFMLNALRLTEGFSLETFRTRTGLSESVLEARMALAQTRGLLEGTLQGYRASARGLQFLNDLLLVFLPEKPKNSALSAMSMVKPEPATAP